MKKKSLPVLIISSVLLILIFLAACDPNAEDGPADLSGFLTILIDGLETASEGSSLDFGMLEAESASDTIKISVTNTGDSDIVVTEAALSDSANYSAALPDLPLILIPDSPVEFDLTFAPVSSGQLDLTVTITVEGSEEPFAFTVTGEGNYPPVIVKGITVTGAGTSAVNGFYAFDSVSTDAAGFNIYKMTGETGYYYYPGESSRSFLHTYYLYTSPEYDSDGDGDPRPLYKAIIGISGGAIPPNGSTKEDTGTTPVPTIVSEISVDTEDHPFFAGDTLRAEYLFEDADGDPEGSTAYQWYTVDPADPSASAAIPGATGRTYTLTSSEEDFLIKVEVTPVASTGIPAGDTVTLGPSDIVTSGQAQVQQ